MLLNKISSLPYRQFRKFVGGVIGWLGSSLPYRQFRNVWGEIYGNPYGSLPYR